MKVLIQCGDHFENQERIRTLVQTLIDVGHEPVVLMYGTVSNQLFKNLGVKTVFLNPLLAKVKLQNPSPKLDDRAIGELTYREILNVEFKRRPEISWPGRIVNTLRAVERHIIALTEIIHEISPAHCIIWNGFTGYVANILRCFCQQNAIPSAFLERGVLKGSLFIDSEGVNGASSLNGLTPQYYDSRAVSDEAIQYVSDIFNIPLETDRAQERDINVRVFFPLQVQRDTNILLYSSYVSMRQAFLDIRERLGGERTKFLLRPHPEENSETRINIPRFDDVSVSAEQALSEQILASDLVVTINSTVGLEALLNGIPVVSLGTSIYSESGLTSKISDISIDRLPTVNRPRLFSYLDHLVSSNLMMPGSEKNVQVLKSALKLQSDVISRSSVLRYPVSPERISLAHINIYVAVDFTRALNLTYRKFNEPITREWILSLVQRYARFENSSWKRYQADIQISPSESSSSVLVVSDGVVWNASYEKFLFVIDVYGNVISNG